jgi:photosystem II stability/assembly factor-like uncharacterized protein
MWTIEAVPSDGTLRKSDDAGRTWQSVAVDGRTHFYALSAAGLNVWAGGSDGKLFHSQDGGMTWAAVPITSDAQRVSDTIAKIDAHGEAVRVKTASGWTFVTADAGVHWEREQDER